MLEAILGVVVVALLVERFFSNRAHDVEVARLTNAVVAKSAGELHMLDENWTPEPTPVREPKSLPDGFVGQAGMD